MGFLRALFRQDHIEVGCFALATGSFIFLFGRQVYGPKTWIKWFGKKNENGELVPVDTILKFRFESILQKFEFSEWTKKYINLYINNELDPNVLGSCKLKNGIKIGVPEYYQRLSDDAIKKSVQIKNEIIDWDSPAGKQFLESLKLDEFAQKYIIACNVALAQGYYTTIDSTIFPSLVLGGYSVGNRLYTFLKLNSRPFILTLVVYAVHLTLFTLLYLYMSDALYSIYYKSAEETVSEFGIKYIKGAIRYYEKKIERNKALRELLKNGHKHYTEDGNEMGIWRVRGMTNTFELILSRERIQDFEFKEEQKIVPIPNPNPSPIF